MLVSFCYCLFLVVRCSAVPASCLAGQATRPACFCPSPPPPPLLLHRPLTFLQQTRDPAAAVLASRAAGLKPWEVEREREEFEKSAGSDPHCSIGSMISNARPLPCSI
eukprot:751940-Hanusia_phi.AAC.2